MVLVARCCEAAQSRNFTDFWRRWVVAAATMLSPLKLCCLLPPCQYGTCLSGKASVLGMAASLAAGQSQGQSAGCPGLGQARSESPGRAAGPRAEVGVGGCVGPSK